MRTPWPFLQTKSTSRKSRTLRLKLDNNLLTSNLKYPKPHIWTPRVQDFTIFYKIQYLDPTGINQDNMIPRTSIPLTFSMDRVQQICKPNLSISCISSKICWKCDDMAQVQLGTLKIWKILLEYLDLEQFVKKQWLVCYIPCLTITSSVLKGMKLKRFSCTLINYAIKI